ncbi:MAG: hypothetical protein M3014_11450 [Chloroflexota bacterium]|nr:hypothetical protein [Chloroflexota bacterium]
MAELDGPFSQPDAVILSFGEPVEQSGRTRIALHGSLQVSKKSFSYKTGEIVVASGRVRVKRGADAVLPWLGWAAIVWNVMWWLMQRAQRTKR